MGQFLSFCRNPMERSVPTAVVSAIQAIVLVIWPAILTGAVFLWVGLSM